MVFSKTFISSLLPALIASLLATAASSYCAPMSPVFAVTRRGTMTMLKGRRGSLRKDTGSSKPINPMGEDASTPSTNWVKVSGLKSISDINSDEGKIQLVDTMAQQLMNGATNPTGAVAVLKYGGRTYCLSSSCSSCKIPLTKAKVAEPNEETGGKDPRIVCDFCSATFNVRTGDRLEDEKAAGLMGGLVKGLMSSNKGQETMVTYDLGERDGAVLINLP